MLRLITFGGLTLLQDGEPASGAVSQRSRLALLAVLAASGDRGVSRDSLAAMFWPDSDPEHARRALNQNIYGTRRYLGSDETILGTTELRLHPSFSSDVAEFEAAVEQRDSARIAALHSGPFLDGIYLRGSAEFERWSASKRALYQSEYIKALERLARDARAGGDFAVAADWLRRLALLDLLNSRYTTELMKALADSGDYHGALSHFRTHQAALQAELGASPDKNTVDVYQEIQSRMTATAAVVHGVSSKRSLPGASVAETVTLSTATPSAIVDHGPVQRTRHWIFVTAVAVGLLVVGVGAALRSTVQSAQTKIIVAPFDNATGDSTLDVFGNLIADWTVARLGDVDWAEVAVAPYDLGAAANSGRRLTSQERALVSARGNHIPLAIAGSFSRSGDTLVIQPVILDTNKDVVVRRVPVVKTTSTDLSRAADEVKQVVAGTLASMLDRRMSVLRSPADRPPRYDAYSLYIAGLERFHANDFPGAYETFTRARSTDTSFVLPLIWQLYLQTTDSIVEDSLLAVLAERRADLTPLERTASEVLHAQARWDFPGVISAADRASALAPGSNWTLSRAVLLVQANRMEEALGAFAAIDGDAWVGTWFGYWVWYARAAHLAGDDDLALRIIENARKRGVGPEPVGPRTLTRPEAAVYAARGDRAALTRLLDRVSANPDPLALGWVLLHLIQELHWHRQLDLKKEMQARFLDFARTRMDTTTPEGLATLTTAYAAAEMDRQTWQTALRLRNARPMDIATLGRLGIAAGRLGMSDVAEAYSDTIKSQFANPRRGVRMEATFWRARIAAARGRKAEAVDLLRQSAAEGQPQVFDHSLVFKDLEDYGPFWELRKPVRVSRWIKLKQKLGGR